MLRLLPERDTVRIACALAYPPAVAELPETSTGLPTGKPLFRSCIVPVGATPRLAVVTVAVTVTWVPTTPDDGTPLIDVVVRAWVTVTGSAEEELGL